MMDYYEELGVARSASVAEIRLAYRRLMQLLHPDHCADEPARRLAELQARRLNAILAMLTDPLERDRYDRGLCFESEPRVAPRRLRFTHAPAWMWLVSAAAVAIALFFLMAGPHRDPSLFTAVAAPTVAEAASAGANLPDPPAGARRMALPRRDTAKESIRAETEREAAQQVLAEKPAVPDPVPWTVERVAPASPPVSLEPPQAPPPDRLAGEWLALAQGGRQSQGLYPPDYIELRVTESDGTVRGKYRARYRVGNLPISPVVAFEFEGRAAENGARFPWVGAGGSRGEVTLKLLSAGKLEVAWVANQMGSELGLISGTATLLRRMD